MTDPKKESNKVLEEEEVPLPPGWTKGFSKSQQKTYYCHPSSKHTQWHFPTATEALDPTMAKKRLQQATGTSTTGTTATAKRADPTSALGDIVGSAAKRIDQQNKRPRANTATSTATNTSTSKATRTTTTTNTTTDSDAACVAIIVPYRDIHASQNRAKHLQQFIPHLHQFLQKQMKKGTLIDYHIYIVEQSNDGRKFNRGKLLNIGFDIARKNKCRSSNGNNGNPVAKHDIFIFHDVDLLPGDDLGASYTKFPSVPLHIARVWDRYSNNPKYFGGIVSFSESDMKRINGYPNTFWGWGGEDDEMQKRCENLNLRWDSPRGGTIRDLEEMSLGEKLSFLKSNRTWKCMVKWEALEEHEKTWRNNGLADLKYSVLKMEDLDLDKSSIVSGSISGTGTQGNSGIGIGVKSRATKITVDVKLNGNHWANEKCSMDFVWSG
jgi:hypothetical protein